MTSMATDMFGNHPKKTQSPPSKTSANREKLRARKNPRPTEWHSQWVRKDRILKNDDGSCSMWRPKQLQHRNQVSSTNLQKKSLDQTQQCFKWVPKATTSVVQEQVPNSGQRNSQTTQPNSFMLTSSDELTTQNGGNKTMSLSKPLTQSTKIFWLRALELQVKLFGPTSLLLPPLKMPKRKTKKNRKPRSKNP